MDIQYVHTGSVANDGTGDLLRDAFIKVNENFTETSASLDVIENSLKSKDNIPTGFAMGLELSINLSDNTKYDIASGYYIVSDFGDFLDIHSQIRYFGGVQGITPQYLSTFNATYVALNENGQIIQKSSPFTNEERRTLVILGAAIHSNRTNINVTNEIKAPILGIGNQLHDVIKAIGSLNLSGNTYSGNGTGLGLDKTEGNIFGLGINSHDWLNPHQLTIPSQTALTFRYRLQDGTEYPDRTTIDPANYDLNGVLTPLLNNNRWQIQHINLFQSGLTRIQPGQHQYNSLAEAENAIKTETFFTEQNIADNAIFRSYLIIRKNTTNLSDPTQAKFIPVDKFGNAISAGASVTYDNVITALGFTPENVANKVVNFNTINDEFYPTVKAVNDKLSNYVTINTPQTVISEKTFNEKINTNFINNPRYQIGKPELDGSKTYNFINYDTNFNFYSAISLQNSLGIELYHDLYTGTELGASFLRLYGSKCRIFTYDGSYDEGASLEVNNIDKTIAIDSVGGKIANLKTNNIVGSKDFQFPNQSGTLALTSDLLSLEPLLGYTPENIVNKVDIIGSGNSINYPSTKAVKDLIDSLSFPNTYVTSGSYNSSTSTLTLNRNDSNNVNIGGIINSRTKPVFIDSYIGTRLAPLDSSLNGFTIEKNINGNIGLIVNNTNTAGNAGVAGVTVKGTTGGLSFNYFTDNYYVTSLRNSGGLYSSAPINIMAVNNHPINFRTGADINATTKFSINSSGTLNIGVAPTTNNSATTVLTRNSSTGNIESLATSAITSGFVTTNTTQTITGNKEFTNITSLNKTDDSVYPSNSGGGFYIGGNAGSYNQFNFISVDGSDGDGFGRTQIYSNPEEGNQINHTNSNNDINASLNINYNDLYLRHDYGGRRTSLYINGENSKIRIEGTQNKFADLGTSLITGSKTFEFPNASGVLPVYNLTNETSVPSSTSDTGSKGEFRYDKESNNMYVCVDTDSWVRYKVDTF